jgi:hypothetical protein
MLFYTPRGRPIHVLFDFFLLGELKPEFMHEIHLALARAAEVVGEGEGKLVLLIILFLFVHSKNYIRRHQAGFPLVWVF